MKWCLVGVVVAACASDVVVQPPELELVSTAVEPPGANCANGGVAISTGRDANGDGVLEASEVANTTYACTAPSQLVRIVDEPAGVHCAAGGQALESGPDANGDGVLEDGEVTSVSYVCASAQAVIRLDVEPPGGNCAQGGTAVRSGVDVDNDGVLEGSEVTSTSFVCVPPSTLQQLVAVVPASTIACPGGGQTIEVGFDLDGDDTLDAGEITSVSSVCGGVDTLVAVDAEPAGPNCAAGGTRIRTGDDSNHDGVLEVSEVDSTRFVCTPSTTINGNVAVHVQADLDALAGVTVITGQLLIDSFTVTAVHLPALQAVGEFRCVGGCLVTDVALPALEAGLLELRSLVALDISALRTGGLVISGALPSSSLQLPLLESGVINLASPIESVSAPKFHDGDFQCNCPVLASVDLPSFVSTSQVVFFNVPPGTITLAALATSDQVQIVNSSASFDLPALTSGIVRVEQSSTPVLSFPNYAAGSLTIEHDDALIDLDLPAFASGQLTLRFNANLRSLEVPGLISLDSLVVASNPVFPTCAAIALWQALGFPPHFIDQNDDTATCP